MVYMLRLTCERCDTALNGKQTRWCSKYCSKLGLKSAWRKRKSEHVKAYNREWRRAKNGGTRPLSWPALKRDGVCLRCDGKYNLQVAHVKPIGAGGNHKNLITLCGKCHYRFDNLLREYWYIL